LLPAGRMLLHMSSKHPNELEQLDRELDSAASEIETELGRVVALHVEEWTARFCHALDVDLISADGF
jgi:hypothetical protein